MNLPLFERLGVLDKVRALGVYKPGADFEADNERGYNSFAFARALGKSPPHAYQVWRQDFDRMLFEHARGCGADAREGHEVMSVEQRGAARVATRGAHRRRPTGYQVQARYVVDASGRDTFLSAKRKLRRKNHEHQSAAIFGHFPGRSCDRAGADAGNISIYRFEHGWMWMIPLPDGRDERRRSLLGRTTSSSARGARWSSCWRLCSAIRRCGSAWQHAELIGDEVRVTGNYSYDSRQMGGPGWVLVGDAFAFLDPVFSSGVYLAMSGAEQAVAVVDKALREPAAEAGLLRRLERRQRAGMKRFSFFIYRFNNPVMRGLFASPRNTLQLEQGVISMLAGDLFDTPQGAAAHRPLQALYGLLALTQWRSWRDEQRYRLAQAHAQFSGGNTPLDK